MRRKKVCVWWQIENLFMSTSEMVQAGLAGQFYRGATNQLSLWIEV